MTALEALSLMLGPVTGWPLVLLLWPKGRSGCRMLRLGFAALLGWGLQSTLFFLLRHVVGFQAHPFVWEAPLVILLYGVAAIMPARPAPVPVPRQQHFRLFNVPWLLEGTFGLLLASAVAMQLMAMRALPGGAWDAFGQWNMRARQLLLDTSCLQKAIASTGHGDYPLLLPGLIARTWSYGPGPDYMLPAVVAGLLSASVLTVMTAGVAACRGRAAGLVAGMALLGTWLFLRLTAYQYADILLAGCILSTVVAFCLAGEGRGGWLLAGAMAGLAVWTKNEGSVFLAVIVPGVLCAAVLARKWVRTTAAALAQFVLGVAPLLLLTLYFRSVWAPPNTLAQATSFETVLQKLVSLSRHAEVLQAFAGELFLHHRWGYAPMLCILYFLLARWQRPREWNWGLLAGWLGAAGLVLAYYTVYVLTPQDLTWHLSTSLNRLAMHVWPWLLFLGFSSTWLPESSGRHMAEADLRSGLLGS